jgi:uncharacterized protein YPO0396
MHLLERIVLCNWGRLSPQDIIIRDMTAILGPTGAGKSTIVDAIQLIVTGSNSRYYDLNKSTGGRNSRSIRDYCLGADDHVDPDAPKYEVADSLIAMSFRDRISGKPISIGLIYSADRTEPHAELRARFVARDHAISIYDFIEVSEPGKWVIPRAARLIERLKSACPSLRMHMSSISYVEDYLHAMRPRGSAPHSAQVLRNFKESIAFKPIDDPTDFVRKHILEEEDIDVEALKGSIERYRFLEAEVKRREEQLDQISEARRRMQVWAQYQVRHNLQVFTAAHAERRRLVIETARIAEQRGKAAELLAREERAKASHQQSIRELEESILRARTLQSDSPIATQLRGLDAEAHAAKTVGNEAAAAAARRVTLFAKLGALSDHSERVPTHLADSVKAVGELIALARGKSQEALLAVDDQLAELERRILRVIDADAHFERQVDVLDRQIDEERKRLDELEGSLRGEATGQMLSSQVDRFRQMLAAEGIEARPLPDLVEVSDPSWAMAMEMLLGANREALLVPPGRLGEAFGILYDNRRNLDTCRLVDVRKTARWQSRLQADSIAYLIVTSDDDARVFIERQIGRFSMAETDADLERLDQAVTRRGKMTAGMSMRVYRDITPILGKTAQRRALEAARQEFQELSASHRRTRSARDALNAARAVIVDVREAPADDLAQALDRLIDARAKLRGAEQARDQLSSPETKKLAEDIAVFNDDIRRYREEIRDEIEPEIKRITQLDLDLQVKLRLATQEDERCAVEEAATEEKERTDPIVRLLEMLPDEERLDIARARVRVAAELPPAGKDPAGILADLAAQARRDAEPMPKLAEDSVRRGRSGYQAFVSDHIGLAPLTDPDDVTILNWCISRQRQLEEDELRQYRDQFENARKQMEADLTEGLINRLSDKFQKAKAQIDRLNRSLSGRTFTGQAYTFRYRLNDALKPIHALAEAIADAPRRGLALLDDDTLDPKVRAGFRDLERRLSDDQLVKELRDYRRFFDFDLHMRNERGQETTLSKRSVTGSGGQKQAPYYVAVGAAMAAAYYPKSAGAEPDGFGLVVFDEAFNNLDAPNTRALLDFFRDLHLQVLIAAPDKVRAMFLENADTIVSVNRRPDNQEPIITVTHPMRRAREALAAINPVNLGVEHYRNGIRAAAE